MKKKLLPLIFALGMCSMGCMDVSPDQIDKEIWLFEGVKIPMVTEVMYEFEHDFKVPDKFSFSLNLVDNSKISEALAQSAFSVRNINITGLLTNTCGVGCTACPVVYYQDPEAEEESLIRMDLKAITINPDIHDEEFAISFELPVAINQIQSIDLSVDFIKPENGSDIIKKGSYIKFTTDSLGSDAGIRIN